MLPKKESKLEKVAIYLSFASANTSFASANNSFSAAPQNNDNESFASEKTLTGSDEKKVQEVDPSSAQDETAIPPPQVWSTFHFSSAKTYRKFE